MDTGLNILLMSGISIGFIHTLIGVDHSLPFVVLGRAQGWSLTKVLTITGLCGLGHVLSSVVLGTAGIGLGVAISRLEWVEGVRGSLAAWTLIIFGLTYVHMLAEPLARRQAVPQPIRQPPENKVTAARDSC